MSSTSLIRNPSITIAAIDTTMLADGIISGGGWSILSGTVIGVNKATGRLGNIRGFMSDNSLLISPGDPTFDRLDVVYLISPAPWIPEPNSIPSPPGYDTERVEGVPSASPVLPGSLYAPSNPYTPVGYDGVTYFAALYSYRVPAGATASSQFTDFTDRRVIVADSVNSRGSVSVASLLRSASKSFTTSGTGIPVLNRVPSILLGTVQVGVATMLFTAVAGLTVIAATATGLGKLVMMPMKVLATSAGHSVTLQQTATKVFRAVGISSPRMVRMANRTLAVAATPVVALRKFVSHFLGTANAAGIPVFNYIRGRQLTGVGHGSATLLRRPTRTLSAVAHSLPVIRRVVSKTVSCS